ncbi:hypothetical protein ZWY2020_053567 [Hordeum vulgare]|nr:hypothetical protein ZWY2020_053567 [Hordeum vulgare]
MHQASQPPILSVLETTLAAPSTSTDATPSESSLPLAFFDVFWLNLLPVENVFFYRLAVDTHIPAILSNLKTSLSQALHAYYPLAARLRLAPGTTDRYKIHYQPGDAVTFTIAKYLDDVDVDELSTDRPREITRIASLAPPLRRAAPYSRCRPPATVMRCWLAIGMAVHHTACDGATSTRFLHTWAARPAPAPSSHHAPTGLYHVFVKAKPTAVEMVASRCGSTDSPILSWPFFLFFSPQPL